MKSEAFKRVDNGMQIRLGPADYITLPNKARVTLDDISGAKVQISVLNDTLTIQAFAPEIPDGISFEFSPDQYVPVHMQHQSLELIVSAIRCEANGKL